jgi:hypothetical protein
MVPSHLDSSLQFVTGAGGAECVEGVLHPVIFVHYDQSQDGLHQQQTSPGVGNLFMLEGRINLAVIK